MNYSTTQATNLVSFGAVVTIIIRIFSTHSIADVTDAEWQMLGAAAVIALTNIISWIDRYKKGDLTVAGFRKK